MSKSITIPELYKKYILSNYKVSTDTRKLEPNSLFFALKGDNFNANAFAVEAIKQGCSFAIVDDETIANGIDILLVSNVLEALQALAKYHRQQLTIPFIGITGSNGKTTNKELIHAVLSKKYKTLATKGNLNNHIGVPLTILSITPDYEMAIIEMGANHQKEIEFLCEIARPNYGIITNIGKAHMEGFGGIEGIKKGKSELYQYIKQTNGKIFLNTDDAVLVELAGDLQSISYGENSTNFIFGQLYVNSEYVEFKWANNGQNINNSELVKTKLFGHYNYINALCAACVGVFFKVSATDINQALENYLPEMNRSQVKKTAKNTLILDAYNANPSSMKIAIENFHQQVNSKKVFILGDMLELGEYAVGEHQAILNLLTSLNEEHVFLVGPIFYSLKTENSKFNYFEKTENLSTYLSENRITESTILIKGSRGIKLEKLEENL